MPSTKAKLDKKVGLTPGQPIWYTKYALSSGKATEAILVSDEPDYRDNCIKIAINGCKHLAFRNEWHTTKESADKQVLTMCANKRKSLQKQLDKIAAIEASIKGV